MLGDTRLKRVAYLHVDQELRERLRDEALAPVLPPESVADLSLAAFLEAHDCAGYAPPQEHRPLDDALVGQDFGPVRHERIPVPSRERSHTGFDSGSR